LAVKATTYMVVDTAEGQIQTSLNARLFGVIFGFKLNLVPRSAIPRREIRN